MAKKNIEKVEGKKVKQEIETVSFSSDVKKEEIIKEPIIEDEMLEPLNVLQEDITLDTEKIAQEIEVMKEEIFNEDFKEKNEEKELKIEIKEEVKKTNKPIYKRLMGYIWNGQEFDM